ncbi:MAG: hypothetical protein U0271_08970 [Polyangiaceae bacterium]
MSRREQMAYGRSRTGARPGSDPPPAQHVATHQRVTPGRFRSFTFSTAATPPPELLPSEAPLPDSPEERAHSRPIIIGLYRTHVWTEYYSKTDESLAAPAVPESTGATVTYTTPIGVSGETEAVFRPSSEDWATRTVLATVVDQMLGTEALVPEAHAEHVNPDTGAVERGVATAKVDGEPLIQTTEEVRYSDILEDKGELHVYERYSAHHDFGSASMQESMANLQVVDWVTGRSPRRGGHMLVRDGRVLGIENGDTFPGAASELRSRSSTGLPPVVSAKVAGRVRSLPPGTFARALDTAAPASHQLHPSEIAAATERYRALSEHLDRHPEVVANRFDAQTLNRALEADPQSGRPTTLLGNHYAEVANVASAARDGETVEQIGSAENPTFLHRSVDSGVEPSAYRPRAPARAAWTPPSNVAQMEAPEVPSDFTHAPSAFRERPPANTVPMRSSSLLSRGADSAVQTDDLYDDAVERSKPSRMSRFRTRASAAAQNASASIAQGVGNFYNRVRNLLAREQAAEEPEEAPAAAPNEHPPFERGDAWNVVSDDDLQRHSYNMAANALSANRVDKVQYDSNIGDSGTKQGFFKPEPPPGSRNVPDEAQGFRTAEQPNYRLAARAVLSSALDRAVGTNVLATEIFAEHYNPMTGVREVGNVSARVDGAPMQSGAIATGARRDQLIAAEHARQTAVAQTLYPNDQTMAANFVASNVASFAGGKIVDNQLTTAVDLRSPKTQEGLANLQVMDYLTAQRDRHPGNIFIDSKTGVVKGIDNDLAFGASRDLGMHNVGLPPVVPQRTADAVLSMTGDQLERILNDRVPPSQRLTPAEASRARDRLKDLQDHIRQNPNVVVSDFDRYKTFDQARDAGDNSYLGRHVNLVEAALSGQLRPASNEDGSAMTTTTVDNPDFDIGTWRSGMTADDEATMATSSDSADAPSDDVWSHMPFAAIGDLASVYSDSDLGSNDSSANQNTDSNAADQAASNDGSRERGQHSDSSPTRGRSQSEAHASTSKEDRKKDFGGHGGRGRSSSYSRPIKAFGRNPAGANQQIEADRRTYVAERLAIQIKAHAKNDSGVAPEYRPSGSLAGIAPASSDLLSGLEAVEDAMTSTGLDYIDDQNLVSSDPNGQVVYDTNIGDSSSTSGQFHPEPAERSPEAAAYLGDDDSQANETARALLAAAVDRALGTNVLASEVAATHTNPNTGETEFGRVTADPPGRPLSGDDGPRTDVDPSNADLQRGLSDLQVVDWLTMQGDRGLDDVHFEDQSGRLTATNNELAFAPRDTADQGNMGMPANVSRTTADALQNMSSSDLTSLLDRSAPPGQRLSSAELQAAASRLSQAQEHVSRDGVAVDQFDDSTLQNSAAKPSYMSRFRDALKRTGNQMGREASDASKAFGQGLKVTANQFKDTWFPKEQTAGDPVNGVPAGSRRVFRPGPVFQNLRDRLNAEVERLRGRFGRGGGNEAESQPAPEGPPKRAPIDTRGPWRVVGDSAVSKRPEAPTGPKVNVNRVDKYTYKDSIPGSSTNVGFFKPEPDKAPNLPHADNFSRTNDRGEPVGPHLASRAVLSSVLDQALGTNVLSTEVFAEHKNEATGEKEFGNLSAAVPGRALQGNVHVTKEPKGDNMGEIVQELNNSIDLKNPETQRGFANLQAIDYLTAQTDRHGGNIYVDKNGSIQGIDNDFSFGATTEPQKTGDSKNLGLPPVVHRPTADAIMNMTPSQLTTLLNSNVPPSERLTTEEIKSATDRLEKFQEHIRNNPQIVVDQFNDSTFDTMRQLTSKGQDTTYLGVHASLSEYVTTATVKVPNEDMTSWIVTKNEDANFDPSKWAPSNATHEYSQDPNATQQSSNATQDQSQPQENQGDRGAPVGATIDGGMPSDSGRQRADSAPANLDQSTGSPTDYSHSQNASVAGAAARPDVQAAQRGRASSESSTSSAAHSEKARAAFTLKHSSHAGASPRTEIAARSSNQMQSSSKRSSHRRSTSHKKRK